MRLGGGEGGSTTLFHKPFIVVQCCSMLFLRFEQLKKLMIKFLIIAEFNIFVVVI